MSIFFSEKIRPGIVEVIKKAKRIVTVEDHNINGGLGSYICNLVCEHAPLPVKKMGLTSFGESGLAKELADHYGFSSRKYCESRIWKIIETLIGESK